ncbi:hypothetical protein [Bacillus sp. Marseille-Q3570]|uniref:hypothetical protein n=1 Tax=Bacillus sp. Marseille-Q3570 TaxID=2963522 RepID=UPI0021B75BB8|nr:hypothetical protein [Bacillus sp. Marseille-Q3570]
MEKSELHKFHRKCAVDLFNKVWDLIEKEDRNADEELEMIHAAHTSRHHWGIIGEPVNFARGEWQISRVYAILNVTDRAHYHAQQSLDYCLENNIGDFDLAYAYEALARAAFVGGHLDKYKEYIELAMDANEAIKGEKDKEIFEMDLKSLTAATS